MVHSWPCLGLFPPLAASSPVVTALPRTRAGTGFGAGAAGPGVGGAAARDPRVLPQPGPKACAELPGGVVFRAGRLVLHRGSSKLGLRHQKEASESLEGLGRAAWSRLVGTVLGRARLHPLPSCTVWAGLVSAADVQRRPLDTAGLAVFRHTPKRFPSLSSLKAAPAQPLSGSPVYSTLCRTCGAGPGVRCAPAQAPQCQGAVGV